MDIELLKKFYRNECSEEELKQVLSWFADPGKKESTLSSIELHWYKFEVEEVDKQKALSNIKEKINSRLGSEDAAKKPKALQSRMRTGWKWAAAVLIAITASYFLWRSVDAPFNMDQEALSVNYVVKKSLKGQKLRVGLKDGSVVTLNSGSKISYRENNFTDSVRLVYLEGEAYFDVAKNASAPFIVSTRNLSITALGTAFNVKTYPEDDMTFVALEHGKVLVKKNPGSGGSAEPVYLDPGEIAAFDKARKELSHQGRFDPNEQWGWKEGILYFNEDNFLMVITKLERWYGVDIVVLNQDTAEGWNYSARYDNVSLNNVLKGISYTKSFDYEINDTTVYIRFKP